MPPVRKVLQLPAEIRTWLEQAIVDRAYGDIVGITDELNDLCRKGGVALSFGKSAIGAESLRIRRAQESIQATTEAARLIAQSAPDEGDNRSAAAMAIVQSEVFELLLQVRESADLDDPVQRLAIMNEAALGLSRLSRSRVNQARWNAEVERKAQAAADQVAQLAKKGGMDARTVAEIRASILGIVKPQPAAQGA